MIEEYLVMHTRPLPDSDLRRIIDISQPTSEALVAGFLLRHGDEDISARTVGRVFDSFMEKEGTTLKALSTDHSKVRSTSRPARSTLAHARLTLRPCPSPLTPRSARRARSTS